MPVYPNLMPQDEIDALLAAITSGEDCEIKPTDTRENRNKK